MVACIHSRLGGLGVSLPPISHSEATAAAVRQNFRTADE